MNIKRISLLVSLLGCFVFAKAQFVNDYLAAADKYFAKGDYYSATQYYEKYLGQEKGKTGKQTFQPYSVSARANRTAVIVSSSKQKVIYNVAEAYRMLHFHEKALPYYEQAITFDKAAYPLAKFHYAATLRAMSKYPEAAHAYTDFLSDYSTADNYAATAQRELKNLEYIQQQLVKKDLNSYTIEKNNGLNAEEGGSYAAVWMNDGKLWFTSTRPQGADKDNNNLNRIYQTDYSSGAAGAASTVTIDQPKGMQQGVVGATPDGNMIFITRWEVAKDKRTAAIYESRQMNAKWSDPVLSSLNATGSNSQQPFVMPDGSHIVFASDRPGGAGGFDLWMAPLDGSGMVGAPVNMGDLVNTAFDEEAPGYHEPSGTFVFSSNGRVGMGGFDIYYSKGNLDGLSEPKNFGYPVNSVKDDLYFTSKGSARNILENVLLSSDRDAACCLELYSLNKVKELKQITGLVKDCSSNAVMANVKVMIVDTINNKIIAEKMTDASGRYSFTLEEFQSLKATASSTGYFNNSIRFVGPKDVDEIYFTNPVICLNLIPEKAIKVDNVYYDFNKAKLQETSFVSLDELVQLLNDNPAMEIELSAHTDSKGSDEYNQKLSDARAQSVVDYLISKGIDRSRLTAKGYGETMPVAENTNADGSDNPEGRQLNRRTEFRVLKN
jgi:outer membrane protein OmpA-like peptidoglycan-associated protein/tetratricopeptide (TPR) repeat protein